MKKQIITLSLGLTALLFVFASCSNNDNPAPAKTKTELLVTGTWKFQSATANGADITNQNPPFEPCKKDNIISFTTNFNGNINEGATKCNAGDPDNVAFTWSWLSNETTLRISTPLISGGGTDFTLESISENQLVISQGYTPTAGATFLIKMTFVH